MLVSLLCRVCSPNLDAQLKNRASSFQIYIHLLLFCLIRDLHFLTVIYQIPEQQHSKPSYSIVGREIRSRARSYVIRSALLLIHRTLHRRMNQNRFAVFLRPTNKLGRLFTPAFFNSGIGRQVICGPIRTLDTYAQVN